ncbi:MAG TPA: epoxide hydrolase [Acidimicrobiales bacterium]|nr:epoxide hydrolase [Acidimicrobiales bacterium]
MSKDVESFPIEVSQADLDDLRQRLRRTRWPEAEPVADWSQGIPLAYTQELCRYWADDYDWRRCESMLMGFGSSRAVLDGLGIHFLHVRSPEEGALPLVLTHGWPGSVVEFHKVIGPLADPVAHGGDASDAFHIVCPALPGFGFSDKPTETGWGVERIAAAWAELMARLGYQRYGAQGGDWGASVTTALAAIDAASLAGIHVNMAIAFPSSTEDLTVQEQDALEAMRHYDRWDSGYSKQQSTRPQTIGYGLVDSPSAQAAWIVEKFWSWTDCDGHPENVLSRDELLDNVSMYWLTRSGASAARIYWESFNRPNLAPVEVPSGVTRFPREIFRPSRRWVEGRFTDLRYWSEPERGGHFAAFEQPERFVEEVRTFFRLVR